MALVPLATPWFETMVEGFNSTAGSQTGGGKTYVVVPHRGKLQEVGFVPWSNAPAAGFTMQVDWYDNFTSPTASVFTTVVTSTLGTFVTAQLFEGAICSVIPATATYVNRGDVLKFTHSGGPTSAVAATVYAVVRRA